MIETCKNICIKYAITNRTDKGLFVFKRFEMLKYTECITNFNTVKYVISYKSPPLKHNSISSYNFLIIFFRKDGQSVFVIEITPIVSFN